MSCLCEKKIIEMRYGDTDCSLCLFYLIKLTFFCQNVKMMETRKPKKVSGFPNGGLNAG